MKWLHMGDQQHTRSELKKLDLYRAVCRFQAAFLL
jgi:hypothetical protein